MSTVRFTEVTHFLAELAHDADAVERRIVRVAALFTQSRVAPGIQHVSVEAGYEVAGQVIRFVAFCGDHWGQHFEHINAPVIDRANGLQKRIADAVSDLGLECRPGMFDPVPAGRRR